MCPTPLPQLPPPLPPTQSTPAFARAHSLCADLLQLDVLVNAQVAVADSLAEYGAQGDSQQVLDTVILGVIVLQVSLASSRVFGKVGPWWVLVEEI
jgi:hypothetical protein